MAFLPLLALVAQSFPGLSLAKQGKKKEKKNLSEPLKYKPTELQGIFKLKELDQGQGQRGTRCLLSRWLWHYSVSSVRRCLGHQRSLLLPLSGAREQSGDPVYELPKGPKGNLISTHPPLGLGTQTAQTEPSVLRNCLRKGC